MTALEIGPKAQEKFGHMGDSCWEKDPIMKKFPEA
jgi:hypothetical protein